MRARSKGPGGWYHLASNARTSSGSRVASARRKVSTWYRRCQGHPQLRLFIRGEALKGVQLLRLKLPCLFLGDDVLQLHHCLLQLAELRSRCAISIADCADSLA